MTGKELRKLRNHMKLSQGKFGALFGKQQSQISALERENRIPDDVERDIERYITGQIQEGKLKDFEQSLAGKATPEEIESMKADLQRMVRERANGTASKRPVLSISKGSVVVSTKTITEPNKKRNPAIRELLEYGLSKSQIADLLGVHITTITNNEHNMPDKGRLEGQFELILGRLRTMEKELGTNYSKAAVGALLYLQLAEPDHPICRLVKTDVV